MKKAFTLIEVNLAMLIMAGGILSMVSLYSLGFRENRQSREDVEGAALADAFMSPVVAALSATNVPWSTWRNFSSVPGDEGWGEFLDENSGEVRQSNWEAAYDRVGSTFGKYITWPSGKPSVNDLKWAMVVEHPENSAVMYVSFRCTTVPGLLMAQPLYFTEVHFQGLPDQ